MEFRIADTFTASLARLTGDEQKAVKTTAFDIQVNPVSHGISMHRIDKSKDKNFWSARASRDLRIIIHLTDESLLLCYAGHHDPAYEWASRRRLDTHPKTGAAQFVEVRELVEEVVAPTYVAGESAPARPVQPKLPLFDGMNADELLSYGIPEEWIADVRAATEDTILDIADHLPAEAAEAVLALATGSRPALPQVGLEGDPFAHPDAQRRFRTIHNVEELEAALDYPWDQWTIFLHPAQRELVERNFNGPARVSGSAGTGKTIVALHRAVFLARSDPDARVLLTTFSEALAHALRAKLVRLIAAEPRLGERIDVASLETAGQRLHERNFRPRAFATEAEIREMLAEASSQVVPHRFSPNFLFAEWDQVVDAWQLDSWEAYRTVARLGRKTRLPDAQRTILWSIFEKVIARLAERQAITSAGMFARLADRVSEKSLHPYDYVVVDEAQDITVQQLRFLAAVGGRRSNSLFFAGDLGQRIFQQPFSWKALGVDIRGRARTLRINYRTSHQIRMQADRLLGPSVSDIDENVEDRQGTVSVFNGPAPDVRLFDSEDEEAEFVASWLGKLREDGLAPDEMCVIVRSTAEIGRAQTAIQHAGMTAVVLDERVSALRGSVAICTMHLAKGLEFRAVAVMACDDTVIPSQERIAAITDESDLHEVYETERHLLYVACTRARDFLLVTSGDVASEYVEDLLG